MKEYTLHHVFSFFLCVCVEGVVGSQLRNIHYIMFVGFGA